MACKFIYEAITMRRFFISWVISFFCLNSFGFSSPEDGETYWEIISANKSDIAVMSLTLVSPHSAPDLHSMEKITVSTGLTALCVGSGAFVTRKYETIPLLVGMIPPAFLAGQNIYRYFDVLPTAKAGGFLAHLSS